MKKILLLGTLLGSIVFAPAVNAYYDNSVTQYYIPVVKVQSFRVPDYSYCCIDPTDKSTCYYRRSQGIPEKSIIHSGSYRMDNNGKKTRISEKVQTVIKPLYLNLSGKPMTEDEIKRIKYLSENYVDKNHRDINDAIKDVTAGGNNHE